VSLCRLLTILRIGIFAGDLVCFFRAAPRIVGSPMQEKTSQAMRLLQSPALVSDAVRRLELASVDRPMKPPEQKSSERKADDGRDILRIMTNLFTFSHVTFSNNPDSRSGNESSTNCPPAPNRRSVVYVISTGDIVTLDKVAAREYIFASDTLADVCKHNAQVAKSRGRPDHERIFKLFEVAFATPPPSSCRPSPSICLPKTVVARHIAKPLCVLLVPPQSCISLRISTDMTSCVIVMTCRCWQWLLLSSFKLAGQTWGVVRTVH
jgi:hypothetical protein